MSRWPRSPRGASAAESGVNAIGKLDDEKRAGVGDTLGPWVVLERLDAGSFGTTYRCKRAGHLAAGDFCLKLARNPKDPRFEREGALLLDRPARPQVPI